MNLISNPQKKISRCDRCGRRMDEANPPSSACTVCKATLCRICTESSFSACALHDKKSPLEPHARVKEPQNDSHAEFESLNILKNALQSNLHHCSSCGNTIASSIQEKVCNYSNCQAKLCPSCYYSQKYCLEHETSFCALCQGSYVKSQLTFVCKSDLCEHLICHLCVDSGAHHCLEHLTMPSGAISRQEINRLELEAVARFHTYLEFFSSVRDISDLEAAGAKLHSYSEDAWSLAFWETDIAQSYRNLRDQFPKMLLASGILKMKMRGFAECRLACLHRMENLATPSFDSSPLTIAEILSNVDRAPWSSETDFRCLGLASFTGWDAQSIALIAGSELSPGRRFAQSAIILLDARSQKIFFDPLDRRAVCLAQYYSPISLGEHERLIRFEVNNLLLEVPGISIKNLSEKLNASDQIILDVCKKMMQEKLCLMETIDRETIISRVKI